MPSLTITRGLPGSGKTTAARAWVADDPSLARVRVNRDDLRDMCHGGRVGTAVAETVISVVQRAAIAALLDAGYEVICDDTNLDAHHVAALRRLAARHGAEFRILDMTDVPVDECIARDARRTGPDRVGAHVIREMAARYLPVEVTP